MIHINEKRKCLCFSVTDSDRLSTNTSNDDPVPDIEVSSLNPSQTSSNIEPGLQSTELSNRTAASSGPTPKKSPLTARERLKAARVLSRYNNTEPKTLKKFEMGTTVLAALKESDKGKKRSGLPEAPMNMFDDSDRGLSKGAWKFSFPGGADLFAVVLSFVLISTVMFTTTYIVWKVGAIHFNEY